VVVVVVVVVMVMVMVMVMVDRCRRWISAGYLLPSLLDLCRA